MRERIEGDGVVLRRWSRDDHDAIVAARDASVSEFADFLPGVTADLADVDAFLVGVAGTFDADTDFHYAIVDGDDIVGQVSLHRRDGGPAEIGYWVRTDRVGHGFATRAVRALTEAALADDGIDDVEILCDEANARSRRVAEKAGYRHVETVDLNRTGTPAQSGREMHWRWA